MGFRQATQMYSSLNVRPLLLHTLRSSVEVNDVVCGVFHDSEDAGKVPTSDRKPVRFAEN